MGCFLNPIVTDVVGLRSGCESGKGGKEGIWKEAPSLMLGFPKPTVREGVADGYSSVNFCRCRDSAHHWEEDNVPDRVGTRDQHNQAVHPQTQTAGRRHAMFEGVDKIFVDRMSFLIAGGS
jgi:hypothetical protein